MPRFCIIASVALAVILTVAGCDSVDPHQDETTLLGLTLEGELNGHPLSHGFTTELNGLTVTFEHVRLFISNIVLERADGTEVVVNAASPITLPAHDEDGNVVSHTVTEAITWGKLDLGNQTDLFSDVPAGEYRGVRYNVGITGRTNHVDATQAPAGHPLAVDTEAGNFWTWNSGYIFLRIDAEIEGVEDGTVTLHLGTDDFASTIRHQESFELMDGGEHHIRLGVDFAAIFDGIDLNDPDQRATMTMDNRPMAEAALAALPGAFSFKGIAHYHDH